MLFINAANLLYEGRNKLFWPLIRGFLYLSKNHANDTAEFFFFIWHCRSELFYSIIMTFIVAFKRIISSKKKIMGPKHSTGTLKRKLFKVEYLVKYFIPRCASLQSQKSKLSIWKSPQNRSQIWKNFSKIEFLFENLR